MGSAAIGSALQRARLSGDDVDEVIIGNVLGAGQGQAPARQASMGAGIPDSVGATTVNKMCGSGMKAAMLATTYCSPALPTSLLLVAWKV